MSEFKFKVEAGGIYLDGHGRIHGPLEAHPSQPELFFIATGATYYHDGRHTSGDLSPAHGGLNLVRRVVVRPAMKITGVSRLSDNEQAVLVSFAAKPSDDDMRALHDGGAS